MKNSLIKTLFALLLILSSIGILLTSQLFYFEYVIEFYFIFEILAILTSILGYITIIKLEKNETKEKVKVIYKSIEKKLEKPEKDYTKKKEQDIVNQIVNECTKDLEKYSHDKQQWWEQLFKNLSKNLYIAAGILFLWDEKEKVYYGAVSSATYLVGEKLKNKKYEIGQGLIGQVAKDKKLFFIDNVPEGYIIIYSGLVKGTARYLIILPIIKNNKTVAVIELASFSSVPEPKDIILSKLSKKLSELNLNFLNY